MFYIGGTKVGALFGEAVVFTKHNTPKHFLTLIKQHGALLAKGFVLGAQFDALFTDNLYFKIARNANEAADRIREALRARGYTLTFEAPTNQIFVTMDQPTIDRLEREVHLGFTEKADDTHTVMRICTSWATTDKQVDEAGRTAVKDSPQNKESREIAPGFSLMYNDCIAIAGDAIQRRLSAIASRSIATNLRTDDSTE